MKSIIVLAVVAVLAVHIVSADPSPPQLAQSFSTNFTVRDTKYAANATNVIKGFTAVDYKNGGGIFTIGGEEYIPLFFHTNFIAHPDGSNIEGYMFEGPLCWDGGSVPITFLQVFPLQVPADATFLGNETVDNTVVMKWQWNVSAESQDGVIELWVTYDEFAMYKLVAKDSSYQDSIVVDFQNMVVGKINPDIYAVPTIPCPSPFTKGASMSPKSVINTVLELAGLMSINF